VEKYRERDRKKGGAGGGAKPPLPTRSHTNEKNTQITRTHDWTEKDLS